MVFFEATIAKSSVLQQVSFKCTHLALLCTDTGCVWRGAVALAHVALLTHVVMIKLILATEDLGHGNGEEKE